MKSFKVKSGNLVFTITYDEVAGTGTMSAGGRTAVITSDFAKGLESLSPTSREDLLDTVFKCRKEFAALISRIDEREGVAVDAKALLGIVFGKVIH